MQILPYVYKVVHKLTGHYYFGFRAINKVQSHLDLGYKYFTSSKIVKPNFHDYDSYILAEFFKAEDAFDFEQSLIKEHWGNPMLINKVLTIDYKVKFNTLGRPRTEDEKSRQSKARKGIFKMTEENKLKMSQRMKGRLVSDATRLKNAEASRLRVCSDATREKQKNRITSDETKAKLSLAHKGKTISEETKLRMVEAVKTRPPMSEATKEKLRSYPRTDDYRKKLSDSYKTRKVSGKPRKEQEPCSESTKNNISIGKKGSISCFNPETNTFHYRKPEDIPETWVTGVLNPNSINTGKRKPMTQETKLKIAQSKLGKGHTAETREKMSKSHTEYYAKI